MAKYWVGGSGNYSDTTHWSASSGGAGSDGVPTASDDVIFDAGSASDDYTVTIDVASVCRDFTMDKPTGVGKKVTWAGSATLAISGSLNLVGGTAGITKSFSGTLAMNATSGTKTIDFNGVTCTSNFQMNGVGGTFQLSNNFTSSKTGNSAVFVLATGANFVANGKAVILSSNSGFQRVSGTFTGSSSFYDFTRDITGASSKTLDTHFSGDVTITHTLTLKGSSDITRLLIYSNTIGTPRTINITGTTGNSFSNVDFKDIAIVTGGADLDLSAITGLSGDCGGNTGITFTTGANMFWYKASGNDNWSTVGNWYLGTGGSGGAGRVPLPQDEAIFDDLSFGAAGMTLTQDMPRIPGTTFAGVDGLHPVANTPTWTTSTAASVFGSLTLVAGMTLTASSQTYTFEGRGNYTLTSAGLSWAKSFVLFAVGGKITLNDNLVFTNTAGIYLNNGTFDANDKDITLNLLRAYNASGITPTIYFGNGLWNFNGTGSSGSIINFLNNAFTIYAENSTLKFTDTSNTVIEAIYPGGYVWNNIWFSRGASTGSITIFGSNTFNQIKDTGTEAHSLIFTAGTTQTVSSFLVNGSSGKLITLNSTTTGTFALVFVGAGVVSCDYLNIQHSVATPAIGKWYAGANSVNNQADVTAGSGWIFTVPPLVSAGGNSGLMGMRGLNNLNMI